MKRKVNKEETEELVRNTFGEDWLAATNLTFDELRVLANLINSWRVTSKSTADDEKGIGVFISPIEKLRKYIGIKMETLYAILNDFETKYRYIDWERGKERKLGEEAKAAKFTIYFYTILSTPAPSKMLNLKTIFSLKKSLGKANINTNSITNINLNINANSNSNTTISPSLEISETNRINIKENEKINAMPIEMDESTIKLNNKNYYLNAPDDIKKAIDSQISYDDYAKGKLYNK